MTGEPPPLHPQRLTWAVMLGRWVAFARSAVALPQEGDTGKLRASVGDLIMLQAVWFALEHLDELDADERALGLDRAQILIQKHTGALHQRWGPAMPTMMRELIDDATAALAQRGYR